MVVYVQRDEEQQESNCRNVFLQTQTKINHTEILDQKQVQHPYSGTTTASHKHTTKLMTDKMNNKCELNKITMVTNKGDHGSKP